MLKFHVSFGILCLAAIAGTSNGAPQGCPNGDCSGNYYYRQLPRSTRYSRGLRDAEIRNAETLTRGVDCYDDYTDLCCPCARRSARSHADTFASMLQDLGSSREDQRRQLYEQDEAFPKMIYKQIPTGHSSKLYVVQRPMESMDYADEARSIHSTFGSKSRRSSLSDDEMEEIVRRVIAELKNKQRNTEQRHHRGPRQPFGASSLVQRPQIKYNPYNLSPSTLISDDVFEPEYEISQFELLPNPVDRNFHIEGDVAVSMGDDDGSSREESSETSIVSDEKSRTFLPPKSEIFDDDVVVLSGDEQISDDERDDAEGKDATTEEAAVLSPPNIHTSSSEGETRIVSTHREDDAEIDSYLVDDVEKPAESREKHTAETSPTPSA